MRKTKREGQVRVDRPVKIEYIAHYKVSRSDELLEFLLKKCNTSRNNVKSFLTRRQVLVNGSLVTQYNFPLAKDDEVKILKHPAAKETPTAQRKQAVARPKPLKILFEDEDFIAVEKPVGLLSVESDKETDCAFSRVLAYLSSQNKTLRPFILHRIDKETSGVLVFAKNIKLHSMLKMRWNELVKTREYYALVEGAMETKSVTIDTYLKENINNLVFVTKDPTGQRAITHYEVVKKNTEYSLLKVNIDTGRKNQIRVHLRHQGHGIVGDEKYGFTKNPISRLGLHASGLEFEHPVTGELITIRSTVPAEFRKVFN
jgi:RluA family pseudouridine synthase